MKEPEISLILQEIKDHASYWHSDADSMRKTCPYEILNNQEQQKSRSSPFTFRQHDRPPSKYAEHKRQR